MVKSWLGTFDFSTSREYSVCWKHYGLILDIPVGGITVAVKLSFFLVCEDRDNRMSEAVDQSRTARSCAVIKSMRVLLLPNRLDREFEIAHKKGG